jgi:hypothetical protein
VKVIDADTHLYEGRGLWAEHADPGGRHLALRIVDDELGHAWLTLGDRRIHLAEVHHPGDVSSMGAYRERVRQGLDCTVPTWPGCWMPAVHDRPADPQALG